MLCHREREEFEKRGLDEDLINLRFEHYQARLIDTINQVLEERRRIKDVQNRAEARNMLQGGAGLGNAKTANNASQVMDS